MEHLDGGGTSGSIRPVSFCESHGPLAKTRSRCATKRGSSSAFIVVAYVVTVTFWLLVVCWTLVGVG